MIRLFRVFVPVGTLTLLISEILLIVAAFVSAAYIVLPVDPTDYLWYDGGMLSITAVVLTIILGLYLHDLYTDFYVQSHILLLQQLSLVIGVGFLMQAVISYLFRDMRMPVRLMLWGSFLSMAGMFAWRLFFSTCVLRVVGRDRMLLVGGSSALVDIATFIGRHPEQGLMVTGYVDDAHEPGEQLPGGKVLGRLEALRQVVEATNPHRIVVGMYERRNRVPVAELLDLRLSGHIIEEAATVYERVCGRVAVKELRPSQLIYSGELGPRRQSLLLQAFLNVGVGLVGGILTLPLMVLTAIAVRVTSAGPILYRQVRVGLDSAPFTLYKFRSMRTDAEAATGAVWATKHDPRVTPVGRIIRRIRFDELPQLFNVLRGEMSIVGPRPERPEFVQSFPRRFRTTASAIASGRGSPGGRRSNTNTGIRWRTPLPSWNTTCITSRICRRRWMLYIIFHTVKAMLVSGGGQ